ncbi:DNA polymerase III subunit delta [Acetivibrio mesophilus]|uniref:DNA polymerase III subunit delta n=1 Tax=Acetivibrio mesophilus TaxID=2487273 RepID=A0A4Q0IA10_9FIRM|nr:DNA polymerase III subunit delta [Acetivibrio mesophilus]RXE59862.1 DNA polymerase III subunit delta [Acetivibrio mesophilus]
MSIDKLKLEIKNENLNKLYLFCGEEEYLKKFYLGKIEEIILRDDQTGLNKIAIEGRAESSKIIEACETMPFFGEKKLVVVKKSELFNSKKSSSSKDNKKDELIEYLQNIPPYTCLVFYEEDIDKRLKMVAAVKKYGMMVEFPFQKPPELVKWAMKVFRSYNKVIDENTASYLIDICETGMTEILNEINKVILYLGDRPEVAIDDIKKVCTKSIKSRIFDLIDAIAERKLDTALKLLNDMMILKEPLPKILFMIAKQLRQLLELKLLCSKGMDGKEACSKMGLNPYVAKKMIRQTSCFSQDKLKKAIQEALELDLSIKTGRINDRTAVEILICNLAAE